MKMKKFLAILLSALLLCSGCITAFAYSDVQFEIKYSAVTDGNGYIIIAANGAKGLADANLVITYDDAQVEFKNVIEGEIMPDTEKYADADKFMQAVNTEYDADQVSAALVFTEEVLEDEIQFIKLDFTVIDEAAESITMTVSGKYQMAEGSRKDVEIKDFTLVLKETPVPEVPEEPEVPEVPEVPELPEEPVLPENPEEKEIEFDLVEKDGRDGYRIFSLVARNAEGFEKADFDIRYDKFNIVFSYFKRLVTEDDARTDEATFITTVNLEAAPGAVRTAFVAYPSLSDDYFNIDTSIVELAEFYYTVTNNAVNVDMTIDGNATVNGEVVHVKETVTFGPHKHEYETTVLQHATCTENGLKQVKCACGVAYFGEIAATGHNWGKWMVVKEATALTDGIMESKCFNCNSIRTRNTEIIKIRVGKNVGLDKNGDVITMCGVTIADILGTYANHYTVYDYTGRTVEAYEAAATGMTIVATDVKGKVLDVKTIMVSGDVNCDAKITAADARRTLRASIGLDKLNDWQEGAADVVYDKSVKASDARVILRITVDLADLFEIFEARYK